MTSVGSQVVCMSIRSPWPVWNESNKKLMAENSTQKTFGIHACKAVLKNHGLPVHRVMLARRDDRSKVIQELCKRRELTVQTASREELSLLLGHDDHQGVMVEHAAHKAQDAKNLLSQLQSRPQPWLVLVLDGVTDPHNLGACLRSADAAGVDAVIAPTDRSASLNPVVRKVAAGAAESVPFYQVTNLVRTLEQLKKEGVWVYGATDAVDAPLYSQDFQGSVALVMGAEGAGIRRLTRDACDGLFSIPMAGSVSSLNVSVATGVTLFEVVRQRLQNKA